MILAASVFRRAARTELVFSGCHLFHCTRQVQTVESTPDTLTTKSKPRPKRCKKRLQDLPSSFTLPDGTPAKPLGDWRTDSLIKDSSRRTLLYMILIKFGIDESLSEHTTTPVGAQENTDENTETLTPVSLDLGLPDAIAEPVKPRRTRRKISQTDTAEATAPKKVGRPKGSRQSDSGKAERHNLLPY